MDFITKLYRRLFGNAQLPLFQTTYFFRLFAPWFIPLVDRFVRNMVLRPWALLVMLWLLGILTLPTATLVGKAFCHFIGWCMPIFELPFDQIVEVLITGGQVWGIYYMLRLTLTKLFYWSAEKYPKWPSGSIFQQMDRYLFRPETFSLCLVTLLWIVLGNKLVELSLVEGNYHWETSDYFFFWLPWVIGGLWPAISVFYHRQILEV